MSTSHIEGEDYQCGFESGQSRLAHHSRFQHRDSKTAQSSSEHAYGLALHSDSVVGIADHLEIVFDTARYVLLSPGMESYFGQSWILEQKAEYAYCDISLEHVGHRLSSGNSPG